MCPEIADKNDRQQITHLESGNYGPGHLRRYVETLLDCCYNTVKDKNDIWIQ